MFEPYLNYTSGNTQCVLALGGPTTLEATESEKHIFVLGQRFFSQFPVATAVDRSAGTYSITIGGAQQSTHNSELLIVIFVSMGLTVLILLLVIWKMIQIRKRRLEADEWLAENQAKLINYALQVKPEETNEITNVLEQSKIQAEITTGKSIIR